MLRRTRSLRHGVDWRCCLRRWANGPMGLVLRSRRYDLLLLLALSAAPAAAQLGQWVPGPGLYGDPHWRPPVASVAALPVAGNHAGDGRLVLDTFALYVWDGDSWEFPASGSSPPMGPAGGDLAGSYPNPAIAANAVALGTDTTGGYAGSVSEAGPATTATALAVDPGDCISGLPRGVDAGGAASGCAAVALGTDTSGGYAGSLTEGGAATAATALAADGTNCSAGNYPLGTDAAGNVQDCTAVSAGVTDHGALTGLSDDDHSQYTLGAGRVGGQTIAGDTLTGGNLILEPTAHATKGYVKVTGQIRSSAGYSAAGPQYSFFGDADTGFGACEPNRICVSLGGTDTLSFFAGRVQIESDSGTIRFGGGGDVEIKRTAANTLTITDGSTGKGRLVADVLALAPRSTAPTCVAGYMYYDSDASTFCACNGTTWVPFSGAGPCT